MYYLLSLLASSHTWIGALNPEMSNDIIGRKTLNYLISVFMVVCIWGLEKEQYGQVSYMRSFRHAWHAWCASVVMFHKFWSIITSIQNGRRALKWEDWFKEEVRNDDIWQTGQLLSVPGFRREWLPIIIKLHCSSNLLRYIRHLIQQFIQDDNPTGGALSSFRRLYSCIQHRLHACQRLTIWEDSVWAFAWLV